MEVYVQPTKKSDNLKKQSHIVRDTVLIGSWEDTQKIPTETLRKWTNEPDKLNGLILKGYEMKWNETNQNRERYDATAFEEFIQSYFVDKGFNMPVDINHEGYQNWETYCGRVLYIETNTVGFYFVVYIPRTYPDYDRLLWALENGIIQGFSKEGYVDWEDYDPIFNEDGSFAYEQIHKIRVVSVSLVATPANGVPFEQMRMTQNALVFENKTGEKDKEKILRKEDF